MEWAFPNSIIIGQGSICRLPYACTDTCMQKPLLVTDSNLYLAGIVSRPMELLESAGIKFALFHGNFANPQESHLNTGTSAFVDGGHDGIIAIGGGSAIDLGKLIAFMSGQTLPVWKFEDVDDNWRRADDTCIAPVIAIPTTAGTGSEVGRAAVLTNPEIPAKKIIFHPGMLPGKAIADPEMCVSMPPGITAGTGMDAFAHCLEAYCSPSYHPMCRGIALEGMRLIKENLIVAFREASNLDAWTNMMSAAIMGAVAFQRGLGAIHALSHPLGAMYGCHHGATNAVIMPHVLLFNRGAIDGQVADAANYLGISGGFDGFLEYVKEFRSTLGIPASLADFGIPMENLDQIVDHALADPSCSGNPVELNRANMFELLESCFSPL